MRAHPDIGGKLFQSRINTGIPGAVAGGRQQDVSQIHLEGHQIEDALGLSHKKLKTRAGKDADALRLTRAHEEQTRGWHESDASVHASNASRVTGNGKITSPNSMSLKIPANSAKPNAVFGAATAALIPTGNREGEVAAGQSPKQALSRPPLPPPTPPIMSPRKLKLISHDTVYSSNAEEDAAGLVHGRGRGEQLGAGDATVEDVSERQGTQSREKDNSCRPAVDVQSNTATELRASDERQKELKAWLRQAAQSALVTSPGVPTGAHGGGARVCVEHAEEEWQTFATRERCPGAVTKAQPASAKVLSTFRAISQCGGYARLSLVDRTAVTFAAPLRSRSNGQSEGQVAVLPYPKPKIPKLDLRTDALAPQMLSSSKTTRRIYPVPAADDDDPHRMRSRMHASTSYDDACRTTEYAYVGTPHVSDHSHNISKGSRTHRPARSRGPGEGGSVADGSDGSVSVSRIDAVFKGTEKVRGEGQAPFPAELLGRRRPPPASISNDVDSPEHPESMSRMSAHVSQKRVARLEFMASMRDVGNCVGAQTVTGPSGDGLVEAGDEGRVAPTVMYNVDRGGVIQRERERDRERETRMRAAEDGRQLKMSQVCGGLGWSIAAGPLAEKLADLSLTWGGVFLWVACACISSTSERQSQPKCTHRHSTHVGRYT
jgi:hypothetical protein